MIVLDGGLSESEDAQLIDSNQMQRADGVEYIVSRRGIARVRGRKLLATVSGSTWQSIYHAGYDDSTDWIIGQDDSLYKVGQLSTSGMSFSSGVSWGVGQQPVVGTHYGNRHYLVNGISNAVAERDAISGITFRDMGMAKPNQTIGVSVSQGVSNMTATDGFSYWMTEFDVNRGIESIYGSTSASTGAFTNKDVVILSFSGSTKNPSVTNRRIYRTADGGVYPDGGLLATIGITETSYSDTLITVGLLEPLYGSISVNGLNFDRDVQPNPLTSITSFEDSLVGFPSDEVRSLAFTPAGYPESWPAIYRIPLQTHRQDIGVVVVELTGNLAVFTRDTIHRVTRLPREIDSAFASGEVRVLVTDERGCISRRGACLFTIPGQPALIAHVSRDGIWATNLDSDIRLTGPMLWETRVDVGRLSESVLLNDPTNQRLVFLYAGPSDSYKRRILYLDYQLPVIRLTNADHGPLAAGVAAPMDGELEVIALDSRPADGRVYWENSQAADDSQIVDTTGSIHMAIRTAELIPAGSFSSAMLGQAVWSHSAGGPTNSAHRFYQDMQVNPDVRPIDLSQRTINRMGLNRSCRTASLEVEATGSNTFFLNWLDIEGLEDSQVGPAEAE